MRDFKHRLFIIAVAICALFVVDLLYLFKLQIIDSKKYYVLSEKNRIRTYPIFPTRGEIYDRNNIKIAINVPTYRLMIANSKRKDVLNIVKKLRNIININLTDKEIINKIRNMPHRSCICVKDLLTWEEYAKLTLHMSDIGNIILDRVYTRQYIEPLATGHILGYVGANSTNDAYIEGKSGVEYSQNDTLFGAFGNQKIEVNSRMKFVRVLDHVQPINGEQLKVTIDVKLQKFIYNLLSEHNAGSCIIIDLEKGHILGAVSIPGIDINAMNNKIMYDDWNKIINDKYLPMNNRIFRIVYAPGSVFKVFLAYAAIASGKISPTEKIRCSGCTVLGKDKFHCWNRNGHGAVNMYQAIARSCDVYFHEIARRLGINNIYEFSNMFGFGTCVCSDIHNESKGLVPNKTWKMKRYNEIWKEYDTLLVGTGQGSILANIAQVATGIARIATGNSEFTPTLLFEKNGNTNKSNLDENALNIVKHSMFDVCNTSYGTARKSCKTSYGIAGKTGSTQVRRLKKGEHGISQDLLRWEERDHALFAGFAPYKKPKYVVAVIIEHGGSGGGVAAPIARKIFDWLIYENNKQDQS